MFLGSGMRGVKTEPLSGKGREMESHFYKILFRFVLKRVKRERKPVSRTDSKLWRKQQSGENNDTK